MFKRIEIDQERELEDLVIKDPDPVEAGLKCLTHQRHANGKFIDVLAVEGDGVLVIVELKPGLP
jgi:RecB family endonuclease NucS